MCRNIRTLHNFKPPATEEEILLASVQYVRKISGVTRPSRDNTAAFERAVEEIADITRRLLTDLVAHGPPKDREQEIERRRAMWQRREKRIRST
jgi:hypothetical protein